mgnify:FL=1|jgi:hypothetical protein
MKEHNFPNESFIGGWYIPEKLCDDLVKVFNNEDYKVNAKPGKIVQSGKIVENKVKKDSLDLLIPYEINPFLIKEVVSYRYYLQQCLIKYTEKFPETNNIGSIDINDELQLQYYKPNGGFKNWHFERTGPSTKNRVLVFMTYLNDVEDGGTHFKYQNMISPAKKGLTIIWPADWTHTHKGQISKTKEKYIMTGWYTYNV